MFLKFRYKIFNYEKIIKYLIIDNRISYWYKMCQVDAANKQNGRIKINTKKVNI